MTSSGKRIMVKNYYKLKDALQAPMQNDSKSIFILANERSIKPDETGRYYTVFPSFTSFLKVRKKYEHCHEILVDHISNKPNYAGRLVFDFDIKSKNIPNDFKNQIQDTIIEVIQNHFHSVDTDKFEFVWSTSQNPKKFSKHLTVKNLYFDNWINFSKIFYRFFCTKWDNNYDWISSEDLIDLQIIRNKASLRMVGSSKINGCPLIFDEKDKYHLTDSLIRIYLKSQRKTEQKITKENLKHQESFSEFFSDKELNTSTEKHLSIDLGPKIKKEPVYPEEIYQKAFRICNEKIPNIFKPGKINGKMLALRRKKPGKCILSNRFHEHENAYLIINELPTNYSINFSCYRYCSTKKSINIGRIEIDSTSDPIYNKKIYRMAFEMFSAVIKNQFEMGKIKNNLVVLNRKDFGKCPISRIMHDEENAFLLIEKTDAFYSIKFGCDSNCHRENPMYIGYIGLDFKYTDIDSNFKQLVNCDKKQKKKTFSVIKI